MSDRHRKNNFYIDDLVKRLGDTIDTKINESNFSDLNETVKRSIDIALDQVNNSVILIRNSIIRAMTLVIRSKLIN